MENEAPRHLSFAGENAHEKDMVTKRDMVMSKMK